MKNFQLAILISLFLPFLVFASGAGSNVDTSDADEHYVWNDVIGWSDWHDAHHNIQVRGDELRGYADSPVGPISLNCATTPEGDVCANYSEPFKVNNDGAGNLSGWAWNDSIGWISFCGNNTAYSTWNSANGRWDCPNSTTYQVKVVNGYFENYAWNDVAGWLDFRCENDSTRNCSNFEDWRVQTSAGVSAATATFGSSIIDTGSNNTTFNTIMWDGALNGGQVDFRIATATTTPATWTYGDWFTVGFRRPANLINSGAEIVGRRYLRYETRLTTDLWQTASPRIDDIIVNYSP